MLARNSQLQIIQTSRFWYNIYGYHMYFKFDQHLSFITLFFKISSSRVEKIQCTWYILLDDLKILQTSFAVSWFYSTHPITTNSIAYKIWNFFKDKIAFSSGVDIWYQILASMFNKIIFYNYQSINIYPSVFSLSVFLIKWQQSEK